MSATPPASSYPDDVFDALGSSGMRAAWRTNLDGTLARWQRRRPPPETPPGGSVEQGGQRNVPLHSSGMGAGRPKAARRIDRAYF
jgi:hypothetical protein